MSERDLNEERRNDGDLNEEWRNDGRDGTGKERNDGSEGGLSHLDFRCFRDSVVPRSKVERNSGSGGGLNVERRNAGRDGTGKGWNAGSEGVQSYSDFRCFRDSVVPRSKVERNGGSDRVQSHSGFRCFRVSAIPRSIALILALLLAACGATQQAVAPTASVPAAPPATAGPTAVPTPGPGEFANPVINQDFPDPDLLKVGETYYAYATNFGSRNIQVAKSADLVTWEVLGDALPFLPEWATPGFTWAPEVTLAADGKTLVMYFTARDTASGKQCIGAATSATPEGPFQPAGDAAFICQVDVGGSIDASSFADEDGSRYVLWKNDGNCCGQDTWLHIQLVSADGLTLEGQPAKLIKQDQGWEGNLVEAPTLWKQDGKYYLFYSANNYAGVDYAVGYAVADAILGAYQKPKEPLLATSTARGKILGPGGQDLVLDKDGETWIVYHSWEPRSITYRQMNIDELAWEGGMPVVKGPDAIPQPVP